jgi:hypothetical protein
MNTPPLDSSGERVFLGATELRPSEKLLLLRVNALHRITELGRVKDGRHGCFATAARLAEDLGVSERRIGTLRARLEAAGLLIHWRGHRCVSWAVTLPEGCAPRSSDADDILRARIRLDEHLVRVRGTIRRAQPETATPPNVGATTEALTPSPRGAVTEPAADVNPADTVRLTPPSVGGQSMEKGGGRIERARSIPSFLPPPSSENGRERKRRTVTRKTEAERARAGLSGFFKQMEARHAQQTTEAGTAGGRAPPAGTG